MEQTECSKTSAYNIQTPGELPRRKHTRHNCLLMYPPLSLHTSPGS